MILINDNDNNNGKDKDNDDNNKIIGRVIMTVAIIIID